MPAVLGAVILHHLKSYKDKCSDFVQFIENCLNVDDLVTGTVTALNGVSSCTRRQNKSGRAISRKWNSNSQALLAKIREAEDTTKSIDSGNNLQLNVSEEFFKIDNRID